MAMFPKERKPAVLGIDFGSMCSKLTLATAYGEDGVRVLRVMANVPNAHPERRRTPYASNYGGEFCSFAALIANAEGDLELVPGRTALEYPEHFPLKTMLNHRAGLSLDGLPGRTELLAAFKAGKITTEMEDAALRKHFTFLRDQAIKQARKSQLTITAIMLSYPNYLCDKNIDFDKYRSFYLNLVSPLWTEYRGGNGRVGFGTISEGQATALYICESFHDIQGSLNQEDLAAVYQDLDKTSGITIAVADNGSSTLNFQVQTMFYDLADRFKTSQSDCIPEGSEGAAGGSQISNDAVKWIITQELRGRWTPDEIVSFVTQFENAKNRLDPDRMPGGRPLKLVAGDCRSQVILTQEHLKRVYTAAYGKTLEILREMVSRLAEHCRDFVVIFCGGSYQSPWLSRVVREYMDDMEAKALQSEPPTRIRHAFLTDYDNYWPSAVSSGAALSAMRLPSPDQILADGSAIGIQPVVKDIKTKCWEPYCLAAVLLIEGRDTFSIVLEVHDPSTIKFRMICDPGYTKRAWKASSKRRKQHRPRQIRVRWPYHGPNCGPVAYDVDWEVSGTDLPPGLLRFDMSRSVTGSIDQINPVSATGDPVASGPHASPRSHVGPVAPYISKTVAYFVTICQINRRGVKTKHKLNKRFQLIFVTDPGTKYVLVDQVAELPV